MGTFSTSTTIQAPAAVVWQTLADIGSIYQWNPGVQASHLTTEQAEGVGACRHCDLGSSGYLEESVVNWEAEKALTMRITDTNMPFKTADIRFTLHPNGQKTNVTVSPIYELKYGLIGKMMDYFFVRKTYEKGMRGLLRGLKAHVENSASTK